ncbi:MAG: MBL fold metallo-hydrolase [Anaerolineae bacterium]|nr:MBL fold metallo-hydrolase [Anaerolineae bacterium]
MTVPPYLHTIPVPTPFSVGPVNVYLAEGSLLTLVDTGPRFDPARQSLADGLAALGYQPSDLQQIILTHAHSDHWGLAAELAAASGARVLTHPMNAAEMAGNVVERESRTAFYAAVAQEAGVPPAVIAQIEQSRQGFGQFTQPLQTEGTLVEGTMLLLGDEAWQVLYTPGHTRGLICLYHPRRRVLLSSDHLLADISSNPVIEPPERKGNARPRPLLDYVASLQRVAQLPVDIALPGHGPPVTNPRELIARRIAFHQERAQHILEALREETRTIYEISLLLFPSLDPINRFLAISEIIGHLEWLEVQGKARSEMQGPLRIWKKV